MTSVGLVYDPCMTKHNDASHPECAKRITEIYKHLVNIDLIDSLVPVKSRYATEQELKYAHSNQYLDKIEKQLTAPKKLRNEYLKQYNDLYATEFTYDCAKLATGCTLSLTRDIIKGVVTSGMALVRPPGHHATVNKPMGFCYFNNIAIAALYANQKYKQRVCILDWDIHHGNGTEDIMRQRGNDGILFISIHKYDKGYYPGTGGKDISEKIKNYPVSGDYGHIYGNYYLDLMKNNIIPEIEEFSPDIILVSCGFDACENDPIGTFDVEPETYGAMTKMLKQCTPKIALILEGGYSIEKIPLCTESCLRALISE
jgi:histone deacetylase 6